MSQYPSGQHPSASSSELPSGTSTPLPSSSDGPSARRDPQSADLWPFDDSPPPPPPRRGRLGWLVVVVVVVVVGLIGGGMAIAWANFEPQIRELLGWQLPDDYEGDGHGEAYVTIADGDLGTDVAATLQDAGVILSADSFSEMLFGLDPEPIFTPGTYRVKLEMSNEAALAAITDEQNRAEFTVTIPEGRSYENVLALISESTGIPLRKLEKAAADPTDFGIPPGPSAPGYPQTVEGYLFPATYRFPPDVTAESAIRTLVDRMFQALAEHEIRKRDWHDTITLASVIQRESSGRTKDYYKISRVFTNRLETPGWLLESDATVAYGTGNYDSPFTTSEERADASNPYNTYANPGLPINPIGAPGDVALDAAVHPADGPWFYFVTVNFVTGETVFSETLEEHNAAVARLYEWCAQPENEELCS